jgi:hypothetical protein
VSKLASTGDLNFYFVFVSASFHRKYQRSKRESLVAATMAPYLTALFAMGIASTLLFSASARPTDHSPWGTENAIDTVDVPEDLISNLTLYGGFSKQSSLIPQSHPLERRAAKDFYLRIMPLGASITYGWDSTDVNGYRKHLRDQ